MDILQSYQRNIPEQEDQKEKDQTGKDEQSDENSLLGFNLQKPLLKNADCGMQNAEFYSLPISKFGLVINFISDL